MEGHNNTEAGHAIDTLLMDVRRALRVLGRAPGLAAAVVLTLALGIGANTAIVSVVRALLIDPLPYRDSSRLAFVWSDLTHAGYPRAPFAVPELKDLRDRTVSFSGIAAIWATSAALTAEGDPERLRIGLVTPDFFPVLGVDASFGRTFQPGDETQATPESILLSWDLWQRRFGSDPAIVGRRIRVNDVPTTVVGVMPRDFRLWMPADANVPYDLQAWQLFPRGWYQWSRGQQFLRVIARMKPGVGLDEASQDVARVGEEVGREYTDYAQAPPTWYAVDLHDDGVREIRPALLTLFAGVTVLLAMACVNVASLLVPNRPEKRRCNSRSVPRVGGWSGNICVKA